MKIGYARVSTADQKLDLQIDALQAAGCDQIFKEKISGARKDRPELEKMLSMLRENDEVIVYKLDRLGRSLPHLVQLVEGFKKKGILFRSLTDNITVDDTAMGQMMFNIFAAFAQFERDLISERTRAGLAAARRQGRTGGRPKGLSKEAKTKAAAAETLYRSAMPVKQIAEQLGISQSTLYRYLKYQGVYPSKNSPGSHVTESN